MGLLLLLLLETSTTSLLPSYTNAHTIKAKQSKAKQREQRPTTYRARVAFVEDEQIDVSAQHRTVVRHVDEEQSREVGHEQHQSLVAVRDAGDGGKGPTKHTTTHMHWLGMKKETIHRGEEKSYLPKPLLAAAELAFS